MASPYPVVLQSRPDRVVVRLGGTVRHPRQPWSASIHALLSYLTENGFTAAPAPGPVGGDYDDLQYIPGASGDDACRLVHSDEAVAQVAQLLRRYHDLVAAWRPEVEPAWYDGQTGVGSGDQLVVHGDPGPWNLVWREDRLVGLIDWEYATVGTRRTDIGYALHYLAPLRDRSYWEGVLGMARKPRRRHRMAVFAEAYGIPCDEQLVHDVLTAQRAGVTMMATLAEWGRPRQVQLVAEGELDRERRAVAWAAKRARKLSPRSLSLSKG